MTQVSGRTAFITGGANGIGLGIARAFAAAGAKLALADLDAYALERARAELSSVTQVETYVLDVRDRDAFARIARDVETKIDPVSLLVNNAGVAGGAPAHKMGYELWDWGLGINLNGVINGIQTFLPGMVERGAGGQIINTASGAGLVASGSGVLYHTSKFAVVGLTEALRLELAPLGIGATVLCPGPVATDIVERTRKLQPHVGAPLTEAEQAAGSARSAMATQWLAQGVKPDDVGQMVLAATEADRLYIHTDRVMYAGIQARTKELLDAMPDGPDLTIPVAS